MKQTYSAPQMMIQFISAEDVLTSSYGGDNGDCYVRDDYVARVND